MYLLYYTVPVFVIRANTTQVMCSLW